MTFKHKISTKQASSIFFMLVGLFFYLSKIDVNFIKFIRIIGLSMILGSIMNFFLETKRKYKITKRFQKNHYDSKAEEKIADYFKRKNVAFEHHPTIKVDYTKFGLTVPFKKIIIEPDFYLPEFNVYVEYWGLIDKPEYKKKQYDRKKKLYADNDLEMLSLYPKNLTNLDFVFTSKLLEIFKVRQGIERKFR